MNSASEADEHIVHEAVGPALHPLEVTGILAMGAVALLVTGVASVLFGSLVDEHRLGAEGIGLCATVEALTTGIAAGLMGFLPRAERLRPIAFAAGLATALLNIASMGASFDGMLVLRTLAGIPEGMLLWITVGMIARSRTPERWSGVFFVVFILAQLALAFAYRFILPAFGADGGFAALALCSLAACGFAFVIPKRYAPLVRGAGETGIPPPRGWFALAATLFFTAAAPAAGIYMQPLAYEAGLTAEVARDAVWVSLIAQLAGGAAAVALAGRVTYFRAFLFAAAVLGGVWTTLAFQIPAWAFIAVNAAGGFAAIFIGPFLVPMIIEADPSRRAAMQGGGTQVVASALGPLLAAFVVSDAHVHGALALSGTLAAIGLAMIAFMHFTTRKVEAPGPPP